MISTVAEFIERSRTATSEQIYNMFEDECTETVRSEIYEIGRNSCYYDEPFRNACIALGTMHKVESLVNY